MKRHPIHAVVVLVVVGIASVLAGGAQGIVLRHDIADAAYLARESEFPAVFSLYRTRAGHRDCLATLVSPRHALTAAHCTDARKLRDALAAGAGYPVEVDGRPATIVAVILPPARPDGSNPDIALLRFAAPITHVAPIRPHASGDEAGRVVLMPGWGGTGTGQTGAGASDGRFRVAENRVERVENGRLYWTFDDPASGKALTLEGISGPGDSGGPALVPTPRGWELAGVSSAQRTGGRPEGVYGVEEVFVRVADLSGWIERVVHASEVP